ncbi:GNAT family N-acetyltransferase [Roseibium sp.]|uniref:GNAT family N-acetyltransferase n=1 Tax=Roseibium sp. TaxID=1936156 RepID=UPI003A9786ED
MTASQPASAVIVRQIHYDDLAPLVEMNNRAIPAVSELTVSSLRELVEEALACIVAELDGKPAGLLLCLKEGTTSYASPNYAWVSSKLPQFAYIDRIFVDEAARGLRIGEALYDALARLQETRGRPMVCEVNSRPPNPGSMRFHERLGFRPIGEMDHGDKAVVFLQRDHTDGQPS